MNFRLLIYIIAVVTIFPCRVVSAQKKITLTRSSCGFNKEFKAGDIYEWDCDNEVLECVKKICDAAVIQQNFVVKRGSVDDAIAIATVNDNKRVIYYSYSFFQNIHDEPTTIAILAHEIGHHLNYHPLGDTTKRPEDELAADQFAGSILCKLGLSIDIAKQLYLNKCSTQGDGNYPPRSARIDALQIGYGAGCRNKGSIERMTARINGFTYCPEDFSKNKLFFYNQSDTTVSFDGIIDSESVFGTIRTIGENLQVISGNVFGHLKFSTSPECDLVIGTLKSKETSKSYTIKMDRQYAVDRNYQVCGVIYHQSRVDQRDDGSPAANAEITFKFNGNSTVVKCDANGKFCTYVTTPAGSVLKYIVWTADGRASLSSELDLSNEYNISISPTIQD